MLCIDPDDGGDDDGLKKKKFLFLYSIDPLDEVPTVGTETGVIRSPDSKFLLFSPSDPSRTRVAGKAGRKALLPQTKRSTPPYWWYSEGKCCISHFVIITIICYDTIPLPAGQTVNDAIHPSKASRTQDQMTRRRDISFLPEGAGLAQSDSSQMR